MGRFRVHNTRPHWSAVLACGEHTYPLVNQQCKPTVCQVLTGSSAWHCQLPVPGKALIGLMVLERVEPGL